MACKSPQLLLSTLLLLTLLLSASAARPSALGTGAWKPLPSLDDPQVVEIAKFAVSEFDKQSKKNLSFMQVVKGESQVVAGTNYRLTITATPTMGETGPGFLSKWEAVVWDKPWEHFRQLTSFTAVN